MGLIRLAKKARSGLTRIARSRSNKRHARRAKALLALHHGKSVQEVAQETGLSRQAIYNLHKRFIARRLDRISVRLNDAQHTGRPPKKIRAAKKIIQWLLRRSPRRYGYQAEDWTVPMLHQQIQKRTGEDVSRRTIRRALNELNSR
ncbi:MAG TPA: helix-turn-helix domain-containing protein [Anaerolineae bacterium]|nr:helix-turn-helix domain-containing protein [Anaerolineae bacterium]